MKALTIKQPFATLIAKGDKHYEFRSWKTNYRGEILIHAGKSVEEKYIKKYSCLGYDFPTSRIVAKAKLVDCIALVGNKNKEIIDEDPFIYGNEPDRVGYAWVLSDIEEIHSDKEIKGKLSIWDIDKY